jgi:transcription elongation factor Elf1
MDGIMMGIRRRLYEKKEWHCDYCNNRFEKYSRIERHLKGGKVVCKVCNKIYLRNNSFKRKEGGSVRV